MHQNVSKWVEVETTPGYYALINTNAIKTLSIFNGTTTICYEAGRELRYLKTCEEYAAVRERILGPEKVEATAPSSTVFSQTEYLIIKNVLANAEIDSGVAKMINDKIEKLTIKEEG